MHRRHRFLRAQDLPVSTIWIPKRRSLFRTVENAVVNEKINKLNVKSGVVARNRIEAWNVEPTYQLLGELLREKSTMERQRSCRKEKLRTTRPLWAGFQDGHTQVSGNRFILNFESTIYERGGFESWGRRLYSGLIIFLTSIEQSNNNPCQLRFSIEHSCASSYA
jgi:hypothetical protein